MQGHAENTQVLGASARPFAGFRGSQEDSCSSSSSQSAHALLGAHQKHTSSLKPTDPLPLDSIDYISNSLKILLCKLCNAIHAHTNFIPRTFSYGRLSCPGILNMLCSVHLKVLQMAGLLCSVHLEVLQIPGLLCSVHLKVLQFPGHEKGGRPQARRLETLYIAIT